jgi:hypothetical protein|nr:MAG TPA: hypothetical protein [Caudoviricetes sp.]
MYATKEELLDVARSLAVQSVLLKEQSSMIDKSTELNKLQHIRISALEEQSDFLFKRICRIHRQIFWYLIAVIIVNIGGLIAFHMVTP